MVGAPPPAPAPATAANKPATSAAVKKETTKKKAPAKASGAGTQAKTKKTTTARRKKTTTKAGSATSAQALLQDARAAQIDMAKQKAQAAAKKSDPLWFRIEDVLPSIHDGNAMVSKTSILPEQVQIVEGALRHNGLTRADVTPQAMACLLEQARRYALELLTDAQDYAFAANRPEVTRADLVLAAEMRADHPVAVSTQLPKLNLVAQEVNRIPLPAIPTHCYSGVLLPPKEQQLTARTYDIVTGAQIARRMVQNAPKAPSSGKSRRASASPGYGASRGRQIPIKLKEQPKPVASTTTTTTTAAATTPATTKPDTSAPGSTSTPAEGTGPPKPATDAAAPMDTSTTLGSVPSPAPKPSTESTTPAAASGGTGATTTSTSTSTSQPASSAPPNP